MPEGTQEVPALFFPVPASGENFTTLRYCRKRKLLTNPPPKYPSLPPGSGHRMWAPLPPKDAPAVERHVTEKLQTALSRNALFGQGWCPTCQEKQCYPRGAVSLAHSPSARGAASLSASETRQLGAPCGHPFPWMAQHPGWRHGTDSRCRDGGRKCL